MTPKLTTDHSGVVLLPETTIAQLVSDAAATCYGVLALGRPSRIARIARRLHLAWRRRGDWLALNVRDGRLTVDLKVQVAAGTPVAVIARNLSEIVRYRLEPVVGLPIDTINVRIDRLVDVPATAA